ncbi:MAG: hypothetical protein KGL74_10650, partial [Elusimicrobia bacterium]|nr:hypothetical protein [Elusimicrobiota bacterium]
MSRKTLAAVFALAAFTAGALVPRRAAAAPLTVSGANTTSWPGSRKVVFSQGYGITWVFYANASGFSYQAFNSAGAISGTSGVAISIVEGGGSANQMYGSVYYVEGSSDVYAIANDPKAYLNVAPFNSVYLKKGHLNPDGTITWGALLTRSISGTTSAGGGGAGDTESCMPGQGVGIALIGPSEVAGSIAWVCTATDDTIPGFYSYIGEVGVPTDLSAGGVAIVSDANDADSGCGIAGTQVFPTINPVNDGGTWHALCSDQVPAGDPFNMVADVWTTAGTQVSQELGYINNSGGPGNANYAGSLVASNEAPENAASSLVYNAAINNTGQLAYQRRTALNTWSGSGAPRGCSTALAGAKPFSIDTSAGTNAIPMGQPSIVLVPNYPNGAGTYQQVYIVYVATTGALNYAVGPATATAAGNFVITKSWDGVAGNASTPMVPNYVRYPFPIPVQWTQGTKVYFDRIIISTYAAPTITAVSSAPATAPLTTNSYDLVVTGSGFFQIGSAGPAVALLVSGLPQSQVTVTSTTFVSSTQLRASIVVHAISPGSVFDLSVANPDGHSALMSKALTFPTPTLTGVYMTGYAVNSAGIEPSVPDAGACTTPVCGRPTRQVTVTGSNFENWGGAGTVSAIFGGPGVLIDSITYVNTTQFTANVNVSTNAVAGTISVNVVNPDGEQATAIVSTFTVTLPTSTLNYPAAGAGTFLANSLYFSSGVAQLQGTAGYFPAGGQTSLQSSQVKVTRLTDGFVWNGANFVNPTSGFAAPASENRWQNADAGGATPWVYSAWTNTVGNQQDGLSYNLAFRGRTADNGWSYPISSFTVTIAKSPPAPQVTTPLGGSVVNTQNSIGIAVDDTLATGIEGPGVATMQVVIQDTNSFSWTGSSWSAIPGVIWLSTDATGSPLMQFAPPIAPVSANLTAFTSLKVPTWSNGRKYIVKAGGVDPLGQSAASPPSSFFYDVTNPTVTMTAPVISINPASPSWINTLTSFTGGIDDSVLDLSNVINVYLQVSDLTSNTFMTAGDTFTTTAANSADNYWYVPYAGNNTLKTWTAAISGVPWVNGHSYRVAFYACNSASNCTGNNGVAPNDPNGSATNAPPAFIGFFNISNVPPLSAQIFPTVGALPNSFGNDASGAMASVGQLYGTAQDGGGGAGIFAEEYQIQDQNTGAWWCNPASTAIAPGSSCYGAAGPGFITLSVGQNAPWIIATSTTTPQWQVWQTTGVPFANGHQYKFFTRAVDNAGNIQTTYSTTTFTYDSSAPTSFVGYPGNGVTYSQQLATISGTALDQPQPFNSGLFQLSLGIQRLSDAKWWTSTGWQAVRADFSQPAVTLNTGVSPNTWSYSIPAGFWVSISSTDRFSIYAWSGDNSQNEVVSSTPSVENVESSTTLKAFFNYEVVPPSSTIVSPTDQIWYSNQSPFTLPSLSGTANDNPAVTAAGVSTLFVEIRDENSCPSCLFWNESTKVWQSASVFNPAGFLNPNWSLPTTNLNPTLTTGHTYRVRSKARDASVDVNGNPNGTYEAPADIVKAQQTGPPYIDVHFFYWDNSAPTSAITSPAEGATPGGVTTITGTAADNPGGFNSGLGKTFVAVCQDLAGSPDNTKCLTGLTGADTFSGAPRYFEAAGAPWSLNTSAVSAWVTNNYYHVLAYSTDTVNNVETVLVPHAAGTNHIRFQFLGGAISGRIGTPSTTDPTNPFYTPASLATLSGTAQGNTSVQIQLFEVDTSSYFDGSGNWISVSTWVPSPLAATIVSGNWSYAFPGPWRVNHNYTVSLRVCNAAA